MARKKGVNKANKWPKNLGTVREWIEKVSEEGRKQPCWLREASN